MTHTYEVKWMPNNHGYPMKAICACGWTSNGYVSEAAADAMGAWHVSEEEKGQSA